MAAPIDICKQVLLTRVLALLAVVPCFNPIVDFMDSHMHRPNFYHPALSTSTDYSQPVNSVFVYLNGLVCNHRCKSAMALAIVKIDQIIRDHSFCLAALNQTQAHGVRNSLVESVRRLVRAVNTVLHVMPRDVNDRVQQVGT